MDATEGVLASSSAPISSWGSQTDLHNSECVSASDGLRDSTIVSTPQLLSSSGVTAGSDDVVDHEASGLADSSVMILMILTQVVEVKEKVQKFSLIWLVKHLFW